MSDLENNRDIEIWVQDSTTGKWNLKERLSPPRESYIKEVQGIWPFAIFFTEKYKCEKPLEDHFSLRGRAYEICKNISERTQMRTNKICWMCDYDLEYLAYDGMEVIWDSKKGGWL